jgi:hypothetical protein
MSNKPTWLKFTKNSAFFHAFLVATVLCGLCSCSHRTDSSGEGPVSNIMIDYPGDLPTLSKVIGNSPEYLTYLNKLLNSRLMNVQAPEITPAILAEKEHKRSSYALLKDYALFPWTVDPSANELIYDVRRCLNYHSSVYQEVFYDVNHLQSENWSKAERLVIRVDGKHAIITGANNEVLNYLSYEIKHSPLLQNDRKP